MEQKINIAELLKDCPSGMELDCTMFNGVYFDHVDDLRLNSIKCYVNNGNEHFEITFDEHGQYISNKSAKCVIYPKGKTTWEGFHRPFKDGDVVATMTGSWIGITAGGESGNFIPTYCVITSGGEFEAYFDRKEQWSFRRLATEEEKQKLFDAIKEKGFKWNAETKTLDKLIVPKFKVGDVIQDIDSYKVKITEVNIEDECYGYESVISKGIGGILFSEQDEWKLVPNKFNINTLKPFDKILVRLDNVNQWYATWFSHNDKTQKSFCRPYITVAGKSYTQIIPYEGNEHLLGTTNDCSDYYKTWV